MPTVNEQSKTDSQTNSHTIKFTHSASDRISFNAGHTIFGDLFMIGSFATTKNLNCNKESACYEYATDTEGLTHLEQKEGEVIDIVAESISSLGMILAYVDRREVGDRHLENAAWLVAGLGELLTQLVREHQEVVHSLHIKNNQIQFKS